MSDNQSEALDLKSLMKEAESIFLWGCTKSP